MKILLNLTSLLLILTALQASSTFASDTNTAQQIVERISQTSYVDGKFSQEKSLQGISQPLRSSGRFIFWKNHGLFLATEKPFFNAMSLLDGTMVNWKADGSGQISQEQNALVQKEINKTLFSFFSADIGLIEQRFATEWKINSPNWELTLTPKMALIEKSLKRTQIKGSEKIESIEVLAANGDTTKITFSEQRTGTNPSAADCHWFYLLPKKQCSDIL